MNSEQTARELVLALVQPDGTVRVPHPEELVRRLAQALRRACEHGRSASARERDAT